MRRLRILNAIMKRTHMYPIIMSFLVFVFIDAFIILMAEPGIASYGDALWYCYAVMATGVVVNFHAQLIEIQQKNTLAAFADRMRHLPELSKEELAQISENVKKVLDKE